MIDYTKFKGDDLRAARDVLTSAIALEIAHVRDYEDLPVIEGLIERRDAIADAIPHKTASFER